jgi:hypothetical protein
VGVDNLIYEEYQLKPAAHLVTAETESSWVMDVAL